MSNTNKIATLSLEQSDGVKQLSSSIHGLNSVSQQNATSSEQIAATSEELDIQAQSLFELISFFKEKK